MAAERVGEGKKDIPLYRCNLVRQRLFGERCDKIRDPHGEPNKDVCERYCIDAKDVKFFVEYIRRDQSRYGFNYPFGEAFLAKLEHTPAPFLRWFKDGGDVEARKILQTEFKFAYRQIIGDRASRTVPLGFWARDENNSATKLEMAQRISSALPVAYDEMIGRPNSPIAGANPGIRTFITTTIPTIMEHLIPTPYRAGTVKAFLGPTPDPKIIAEQLIHYSYQYSIRIERNCRLVIPLGWHSMTHKVGHSIVLFENPPDNIIIYFNPSNGYGEIDKVIIRFFTDLNTCLGRKVNVVNPAMYLQNAELGADYSGMCHMWCLLTAETAIDNRKLSPMAVIESLYRFTRAQNPMIVLLLISFYMYKIERMLQAKKLKAKPQ